MLKRHVGWDEVERLTLTFAPWAKEIGVTHILAVARGGLAPAAILAHAVGIDNVQAIGIQVYKDAKTPGLLRFLHFPELVQLRDRMRARGGDLTHPTVLVLDDILDTGTTVNAIRELFQPWPLVFGVLFAKKSSPISLVDLIACPLEDDPWIVFPWEKQEAS